MQVLFETRDPRGADYRELAVHRVRFALRRLTWLVPRAVVQLSDLNGPRGGVDKRCRVALTVPGAGSVVVTAVARDWRSALDQAVSRATRALLRLWRRSRETRRAPVPVAAA
jgi:hypothetical protein